MSLTEDASAKELAERAIARGWITPARPRHFKTPQQIADYKVRRRANKRECMRRIRAAKKCLQAQGTAETAGESGI